MRKKSKILLSAVSVSVLLFSCSEEVTAPVQISGKWIESKERLDTLIFGYDNVVELKRGKNLSGLSLFSSFSGAGIYKYTLSQDSINLNYLGRGTLGLQSYAFRLQGDMLYISDFYKKNQVSGSLLSFKRLK